MAMRLKQKGFNNITIYETSNSLGGSQHDADLINGVSYSLFSTINGDDTQLLAMARKYLPDADIVEEPPMTIWSKIGDEVLREISLRDYLINNVKQATGTDNTTIAIEQFKSAVDNYKLFKSIIFPNGIDGEILKEPTWLAKNTAGGSLSNFLSAQIRMILKPIFLIHLTLRGYGHPDDISTLVAMLNLKTSTMDAYKVLLDTEVIPDSLKSYVIKGGYRVLLDKVSSDEGISISQNSMVDRLYRESKTPDTSHMLRLRRFPNNAWEIYKFVIWADHLFNAVKSLSWARAGLNAGPAMNEYQRFLRIKGHMYKQSAVFESEEIKRGGTPIDLFIDELSEKGTGVVMLYDSYAVLNGQTNTNRYRNGNYPVNENGNSNGRGVRTMQAIHFTDGMNVNDNFFGQVQNEFAPVNVTFRAYRNAKVNPYFERKDIANGMLWRILEMQGKYGMWYTGGSVYHDSIESQLSYNELLINKMGEYATNGEGGTDGNVIV